MPNSKDEKSVYTKIISKSGRSVVYSVGIGIPELGLLAGVKCWALPEQSLIAEIIMASCVHSISLDFFFINSGEDVMMLQLLAKIHQLCC